MSCVNIEHLAIGQHALGQGTITGLTNYNGAPASGSTSISFNLASAGNDLDFVSWQSDIVIAAGQTDTVTQLVKGRMSPDFGWVTLDTHTVTGGSAGTYSRAATLVRMAEYCSEVTAMTNTDASGTPDTSTRCRACIMA